VDTLRKHPAKTGSAYPEEAVKGAALRLGIDIGSVSSDILVLDDRGHIHFKDYQRTYGRPVETALRQLERLSAQHPSIIFDRIAVTGSAGRRTAQILGATFVNEVRAQSLGVAHLYPEFSRATVIEMGGQDSKLIFLDSQNDTLELQDFALNSVCAAGTGSFLDQQAERLGVSIEDEFGRLALQSVSIPQMAGRCSVFAKSDMIHLQQIATPVSDILAGLCMALARSLKTNLGCGREFVKPIIFTGGVAANAGVVRAFETVLGLEAGELIVPILHGYTGALGAALAAPEHPKTPLAVLIQTLQTALRTNSALDRHIPHQPPLKQPTLPPPHSRVYEELLSSETPVEAYLGVDVGSISTNVAVVDADKRVLAKEYLMTAGRPLEAVREGLRRVGQRVAGKVRIVGAATTGSGRYLTGEFLGADVVINEITAQAAGAVAVCPDVDTIFEIGGQDSKYIRLENGVVVDFEMNHACAAGTGSFLEEQAQRLGISIKDEFAALAMKSQTPVQLGERCTVFIESDLLGYQQQGAATEDLVAGLAYSIATNYLNRVVGRRKIGEHICFQGGTAFNKAVWAAFETVIGKPIRVPDHHEMTGAIGAALIAAEHVQQAKQRNGHTFTSRFKGFGHVTQIQYDVQTFTCQDCSNACEIKQVRIGGDEPLYYGSRCDRYNIGKQKRAAAAEDLLAWRTRTLFACAGQKSEDRGQKTEIRSQKTEVRRQRAEDGYCIRDCSTITSEISNLKFQISDSTAIQTTSEGLGNPLKTQNSKLKTIAIPRALISWQLLPLFSRFFQELGCKVVVSGKTTKKTIREGIEAVPAQPCFPVKAAFGHVRELLAAQPEYLFIPCVISMTPTAPQQKYHKLCPYVQSFAFQVRSAMGGQFGQTQLLTEPLYLGDGDKAMRQSFRRLAAHLGVGAAGADAALTTALSAQQDFNAAIREKGRQIVSSLKPHERLFVLISRPYNGLDDGMNLRLTQKLEAMGVKWMPMEMLDVAAAPLTDESLHRSVYWSYGQRILRAAEIIRRDDRMFAIYLSNFSCGPDSFLQSFFTEIMRPKPALMLELDEHSADAGLVTRLEAFFESLKRYRPVQTLTASVRCGSQMQTVRRDQTLYIPYIGDVSHGFAAAFRAYGQPAQSLPIADEQTLRCGRRHTTGKECLPCAITVGEMLRTLERPHDSPPAFVMPGGCGPCRFGMYNCLQRQVLAHTGHGDIQVLSPNQDNDFYKEFAQTLKKCSVTALMKTFWKGAVGADLLHKALLRVRPYAKNPAAVEALHRRLLEQWCNLIEQRQPMRELTAFMEQAAGQLAAVPSDRTQPRPRIGVLGEIYVRSNPFSNSDVIRRLESLGAACELTGFSEWIYYVNAANIANAKRKGQWRIWLRTCLQNAVQRAIEKRLAAPLERHFGTLAEEPIADLLAAARPYIDPAFEGEAVLSVGKTVEFFRHGYDGVVNVMPFSCMPSTIVCTQTQRLTADCGGMPILNLSFDGQEDPSLTTRLEAFVEQLRRRRGTPMNQKVNR